MRLRRYREKDRVKIISLVLVTALVYPINAVHEAGHAIVCSADGGEYTISASFYGFGISCHQRPQSILLYWTMGGVFGILASAAPLTARFSRNSPIIKITLATLITTQFLTLVLETFAHYWYINEKSMVFLVLGSVSIALWYTFYLVFYKRSKAIS